MKSTIKQLKKGDLFKIPTSTKTWVRGEYERNMKRYSCTDYDDINLERFFRSGYPVNKL